MASTPIAPRRSTRTKTAVLKSPAISSLLNTYKRGVKPPKKDQDEDEMACKAVLTTNAGGIHEGEYTSGNSQHAEMNALDDFVSHGGAMANVKSIVISSPPCTACAVMLDAFGLKNKITAGSTYKDFTGSWRLPELLRNANLITNQTVLEQIRMAYGVNRDDASSDDRIFERFWKDLGRKVD